MLRHVQTDLFVVLCYPELRENPYDTGADQRSHNRNDDGDHDTDDLCPEQMEISENESVPLSHRIDGALGEETRGDAAPDSSDAVAAKGVQSIVVAELFLSTETE